MTCNHIHYRFHSTEMKSTRKWPLRWNPPGDDHWDEIHQITSVMMPPTWHPIGMASQWNNFPLRQHSSQTNPIYNQTEWDSKVVSWGSMALGFPQHPTHPHPDLLQASHHPTHTHTHTDSLCTHTHTLIHCKVCPLISLGCHLIGMSSQWKVVSMKYLPTGMSSLWHHPRGNRLNAIISVEGCDVTDTCSESLKSWACALKSKIIHSHWKQPFLHLFSIKICRMLGPRCIVKYEREHNSTKLTSEIKIWQSPQNPCCHSWPQQRHQTMM